MSDRFTVEHKGVEYTITPKKRSALIEMMMDYQFSSSADLDDPDHVYSAINTAELGNIPLFDLLVESVNDIPAEDVTDSELDVVAAFAVMYRLYADTDKVESFRKWAEVNSIMRPAWDAIEEKLRNGTLDTGKIRTVGSYNLALQREARKMPSVILQLQALGDDCPEWAKQVQCKSSC